MKKAIYVLFALLTIIGMVSCGGGGGGDGPYKVTFDVNLPAGYDGQIPTAPDSVDVTKAGDFKLTAAQLNTAPEGYDPEALVFKGWSKERTGALVTVNEQYKKNTTLYAQWQVVDPDTQLVLKFDLN